MRKNLLYWFLGLTSVGNIAGCGALGSLREQCTGRSCSTALPQQRGTACQWAKTGQPKSRNPSALIAQETEPRSTTGKSAPILKPMDLPSLENVGNIAAGIESPDRQPAMSRNEIAPPIIDNPASLAQKSLEPPPPRTGTAEPEIIQRIQVDKENTPSLKSAQILPAAAEKFKSLTGQVQRFRSTWRLRYAPIEQEDTYGGVVVLEGGAELNKLRDGQQVHVTGVLTPPASRTHSATYRVNTIMIAD